MKATDLIKRLEELVENYGDLDLIYSSDSEGNYYNVVVFSATQCGYKNNQYIESTEEPTHICIN